MPASFFALVMLITAWTADGHVDAYAFPVPNKEGCGRALVTFIAANEKSQQYVAMSYGCVEQFAGDHKKA